MVRPPEDVSTLEHANRLVVEFLRIPTIPDLSLNSCEFSYGFDTASGQAPLFLTPR